MGTSIYDAHFFVDHEDLGHNQSTIPILVEDFEIPAYIRFPFYLEKAENDTKFLERKLLLCPDHRKPAIMTILSPTLGYKAIVIIMKFLTFDLEN